MTLAKSGPQGLGKPLVPGSSAAGVGVERYLLEGLSSSPAVMTSGAGRRRAEQLLLLLGSPQESLRLVHVAGTAGKGSVSTYIASLLRAHGFRTGAYLSPHVHSVFERFQIDGRHAPARELAAAVDGVRNVERLVSEGDLGPVTMFEAATAAAFKLFRDTRVDYGVVETGIGGLHDATNTVARSDKLAVLTPIGMDHTELLGPSLSDIASQKAGILAKNGAALAVRSGPAADGVVAAEAVRLGCRLDQPASAQLIDEVEPYIGAVSFSGAHQRVNAGLALRAVRLLADRDGWELRPDRLVEGLRKARMPGRFEERRWRRHPLVLDGAHNPMKLAALAEVVRERWPGRAPVWVLSLKSDKDLQASVDAIAPAASAVVGTEFASAGQCPGLGTALPVGRIAEAARRSGLRASGVRRLPDALGLALSLSAPDVPVIVAGSFHLVADVGKVTEP